MRRPPRALITASGLLVAVALIVPLQASDAPAQAAGCAGLPAAVRGVLHLRSPAGRRACAAPEDGLRILTHELRRRSVDPELAWRTADTALYLAEAARESWEAGRIIRLGATVGWAVPTDPDWTEDPYSDQAWLTRYHSLAWLLGPAEAARDGDAAAAAQVAHYVMDWIGDNRRGSAASARAWYDGSVWRRTNALVLMSDVLFDTLDPDGQMTLLQSLHQHARVLEGYLSSPQFIGHNHNLFHALALISLATNRPELRGSDRWRVRAVDRLRAVVPEVINTEDGVSTEQASAYHALAMQVVLAADAYLRSHGIEFLADLGTLPARTTTFGALLPDPAELLPAVGDTAYGASAEDLLASVRAMAERGLATPEAEYVLTRGREGRRPRDATFFAGEGYAIFRPSYGDRGAWSDDLHVLVDLGPSRRVHGHNDAMNILLSAWGRQLLVDSGGPYQYRVPKREYFLSASAHNTVVVDRGDYRRGDVRLELAADEAEYSAVVGSHTKSPGVLHRRAVIMLKPDIVVVLDELSPTDARRHRFELLYHLPAEADVVRRETGAAATVEGAAIDVAVASSAPYRLRVRAGQERPQFGWVTPENRVRLPAPVLDFVTHAGRAWFVTVLRTGATAPDPLEILDVNYTGTEYRIKVRTGLQSTDLSIRTGAVPLVQVGRAD